MRNVEVALLLVWLSGLPAARANQEMQEIGGSDRPTAIGTAPSMREGDTASLDTPGAHANPNELVRHKWVAVSAVLANPDLSQLEKEEEIERIVNPIIDFPLMAKLAIGRSNWSKFTPAQRATYHRLFEDRLKRTYREKIARYNDEIVHIEFPAAPANDEVTAGEARDGASPSKKTAHISIEVQSGGETARILHKFRIADGRWKLYDVEIQGVSILLTYRSQFDDLIKNGSIDALLERLQEPPR